MKVKCLMAGLVSAVLCAGMAWGTPMLNPRAESVADGEIRLQLLAGAQGVPAPTLQARTYRLTRGAEVKETKLYVPADLWRRRAFAGEWKDKRGNRMRLARVKSLVPAFEREDWFADQIEAKLDELEGGFAGDAAELEAWRAAWSDPKGVGRFLEAKNGRRYYVEFIFVEQVKPAEADKLLKGVERSLSTLANAGGAQTSSMKWWETETPQYLFLTDLNKAKGGKFMADAMRLMSAMRKGYEYYVPPMKTVGVGKVRIFRSLAGYRDYRASTGEEDRMSCGLWDPSREELLIAAEDPKSAQLTMRHEAFHQYLHYATGRGDHAMWFNEGHACFFENVKYNPAKNTIRVMDVGNRAQWVARDPALYANEMRSVLAKDRAAFYLGDVNRNYCTAWAICYFLEKGAYTTEAFAPYREIVPTYLKLMASGASAADATAQAWAAVKNRDLEADFLTFWKEKRKAALGQRL